MGFFTDKMTVEEILDLGDDILSSLKEEDMSRALRTVALAANKRVKRLQKYAKKRGGKYVEKVNGPGLDLTVLNKLKNLKFGVGRGVFKKNRNQMYEEFSRIRSFMRQKASTIKGAKELRQKKEMALFGQTREEMTKGMSKKEAKEKIKEINALMPEVYETYEDYQEEYAMKGGYDKEEGKKILQDIGRDMLEGISPEAAKANAAISDTKRYEAEEAQDKEDFWKDIEGEAEWWEEI